MVFADEKEQFKEHQRLGGIAARVAAEIEERTGKETRSLVLGHLQRGGPPVTSDRLLALRLGSAATRFLAETLDSGMVAVVGGKIQLTPLSDATSSLRTVPADSDVLQTGRDLGLCFGDEPAGTFMGTPSAAAPPPKG
jgi:6-phosphofructokinase 1